MPEIPLAPTYMYTTEKLAHAMSFLVPRSFTFCSLNPPEFVQWVDRNVVNTVGKIKEIKDSLRGTSNDGPSTVRSLGPSFHRKKLPPCCHRDTR